MARVEFVSDMAVLVLKRDVKLQPTNQSTNHLDGVAPSWMVGVSASDNLSLHHKVQKFSLGGPGKRAIKQLCV